jgi:hypothetical protein
MIVTHRRLDHRKVDPCLGQWICFGRLGEGRMAIS